MNAGEVGNINVGGLETICFLSQSESTDLISFSKHNVFVSEKKKQSQAKQKYSFNAVYSDKTAFEMNDYLSNELLNNVFRGSSSLVISYGATRSGKTTVLFGTENPIASHASVAELFLWKLFAAIEREPDTFSVGISYFELAGKLVGDLLGPEQTSSTIDSLNLSIVEAKSYVQARNMLSVSRCRSRNWSSIGEGTQMPDPKRQDANELHFPSPISNVSHEFIRVMVHDKIGHFSDGVGTTTTVLLADLVGVGSTGKTAPSQLGSFIKDLQTIATTEASIQNTNSELSELLLSSIYGSNTYIIGFVRPVPKLDSRVEMIDEISTMTLLSVSSLTNKIAVGLSPPVEGSVVFLPPEVAVTSDFLSTFIFGDMSVISSYPTNDNTAQLGYGNGLMPGRTGGASNNIGMNGIRDPNITGEMRRLGEQHGGEGDLSGGFERHQGAVSGIGENGPERGDGNGVRGGVFNSRGVNEVGVLPSQGAGASASGSINLNELSGRSAQGNMVDIRDYNKTLELLERSQAACKELEQRIEQAQAVINHTTEGNEPQLEAVKEAVREVEKNIMPMAKHVNIPFAYGWNCLAREAGGTTGGFIPTLNTNTNTNTNTVSDTSSQKQLARQTSRVGERQAAAYVPGLTQNGFVSIVDIFELYDREERYLQDVLSAEAEEGRKLEELLKATTTQTQTQTQSQTQTRLSGTMKTTQSQLLPLKKHIRSLLSQRQKLETDISRLEAEYRRMLLVYRWTISLDAREAVGLRELERLEKKLNEKRALMAREEKTLNSAKQISEQSMVELRKTVEGYRANFLSVAGELNKLKTSIANALNFKMGTRQENLEPQLKQALKKGGETATKLFAAVKLDPGIIPELVTVCSGIGQLIDKASRYNEERREFADQKERLLRRNFDASRQSIEELSAIVARISARMKDLGQFIVSSSKIE